MCQSIFSAHQDSVPAVSSRTCSCCGKVEPDYDLVMAFWYNDHLCGDFCGEAYNARACSNADDFIPGQCPGCSQPCDARLNLCDSCENHLRRQENAAFQGDELPF